MNNIILTTPQVQAIIYLLDEAPEPLLDFYFENEDKVFKENRKRWYLPITYKCKKWMQTNLGGYAKNLAEMVKESIDSDDEYWREEAKANRQNIEKVKRILNKL